MPNGRMLGIALLTLGVAAAPAGGATVRAPKAFARDCAAKPVRAQSAGRATYRSQRDGLLTVRLAARRGDWDLALFDARTRERVRAAAGLGARETLTAGVQGGRSYLAQACRRSGSARTARLSFRLTPSRPGPQAKAQLLRVALLGERDHERLEATGLDVTHNHGDGYVDVVAYGPADRRKLLTAGFAWEVRVADLAAQTRRALRVRARAAQDAGLPSGRTAYRTLADYETDLKALAESDPQLVRPFELGRSVEDRPIQGLEIATGVSRSDDGRPVLAVLGLHHAREWPSGEMPMELATDLVKHADDPRVKALLDRVRVIVVPVMNPDGFEVSRSAPTDAEVGEVLAYKRKNCRPDAGSEDLPCALRLMQGVDLNRNYGAFWGGVGSSSSASSSAYRGPAPFSEPESEAFHKLSQTRNIVTVISHHTFTEEGVWLRQPGFCMVKPEGACSEEKDVVPDEAGMKLLGDAMGQASGWQSLLGWKIGEITGATEDWNYFAAGAYGYTPEQRSSGFHAAHADAVVAEWPGVREALLRAGELTADPSHHSVVSGLARPGHLLRLKKAFDTPTSVEGTVVQDTIDLMLSVPQSGEFAWHVNPSTRPLSPSPEAYVVTCEDRDGAVVQEKTVVVQRGKLARLSMGCGAPDPVLPEDSRPAPAPASEPTPQPTPEPTPQPTPEPTAAPAPFVAPAPTVAKAPPKLAVPRTGWSARRFNRRGRVRVPLRVDGGRVLGLTARLVGRRGATFARAGRARIDGDTHLTLRRLKRRRLERGRYTLVVQARDARGRAVMTRRVIRVRR